MFRVSTLDLENLPRDAQGKVDFNEDFFGKEAFLTVSGQLNGETYACALSKFIPLAQRSAPKTPIPAATGGVLDVGAGNRLRLAG